MERPTWWNGGPNRSGPVRIPPAGTRLKSHYRARWTGDLIEANWHRYQHHHEWVGQWIITVRITHDRNGRPLRKPRVVRMNAAWLEVLAHDDTRDHRGEDDEEQNGRKTADDCS
jgi:hypothetical protein